MNKYYVSLQQQVSKFKKIHDEDDEKESENNEVNKFINSVHMQQVILRVSKTLGLDRNLTYSNSLISYNHAYIKC